MDEEILKYKDDSYVVRDTFKSKEYFLKQLEEINERINKYKTYFENGVVKDMHMHYISIANRLLEKIKVLQTLGENRENIKSLVEEYCDAVEKIQQILHTMKLKILYL